MARKTVGQRRAEYDAKAGEAWREFSRRLSEASSIADVAKLVTEAPEPDSPGRTYYSNLAFFALNSAFTLPENSNENEAALYLGLIERFLAARIVRQEHVDHVRAAAKAKFPWVFDR